MKKIGFDLIYYRELNNMHHSFRKEPNYDCHSFRNWMEYTGHAV